MLLRPALASLATLVFALTLALALAPRAASAQVNVESLRNELKQTPRFLSLEGSVTGRLGNSRGIIAGAAVFGGVHFLERHLIFLKAQGDYAAFGDKASVAKSFAHVRYTVALLPWLSGEVFAQIQQDKFQRLRLRQVDGIGPRFGLVQRRDLEVFYGTSYMLEYEVLSDEPGGPDLAGAFAHRWNNYLSLVYRFGPTARFASVIYVQPRFDDFGDVRVLSDSSVIVELITPLKLKLGVILRHDTRPPTDVLSTDFESKNSLVVTF
ncbi:MAG: DUF481 domain-containing protein [Minicystis sp.]